MKSYLYEKKEFKQFTTKLELKSDYIWLLPLMWIFESKTMPKKAKGREIGIKIWKWNSSSCWCKKTLATPIII